MKLIAGLTLFASLILLSICFGIGCDTTGPEPEPAILADPGVVNIYITSANGTALESPSIGGVLLHISGIVIDKDKTEQANSGHLLCRSLWDSDQKRYRFVFLEAAENSSDSFVGAIYLSDRNTIEASTLTILYICDGANSALVPMDYGAEAVKVILP